MLKQIARIFGSAASILALLLLAACGGGGGSPGAAPGTGALSVGALTAVNLQVGASTLNPIPIRGGTPPYTVASSNEAVAQAGIGADNSLVLGGRTAGTATVIVRDRAGASVSLEVTVAPGLQLSSTAPAAFTLGVTELRNFSVAGGVAPYTIVSSNEAIASVVNLGGGNWSILGRALGDVNVVIRDATGAELTRAVTVAAAVPLSSTAPAAFTLGVTELRNFSVAGGVAPYTITGSNEAVAAVSNLGGGNWSILGRGLGTVNVVIRDATGAEITRAVTVQTLPLAVSSSSLTLPIDIPAIVTLTGGQPPYRVLDRIPAALSVTPVPGVANEFQIVGRLVSGNLDIAFADAANQTVRTSVTINAATPGVRLSPSALTISELGTDTTQPIRLMVFGAVGEFTVFSSHLNLLQPEPPATPVAPVRPVTPEPLPEAREIRIVTGLNGNRCIDLPAIEVTITVVDSTRAVGTSVITIQDRVVGAVAPCP